MSQKESMPDFKELKKFKRKGNFYARDSVSVAREILGDYLVLRKGNRTLVGKIVETEAYRGRGDDASHTFAGKVTPRNRVMYERGGVAYVYLIYGMWWCFNIVVSSKGDPGAVFIRALEPLEGMDLMMKKRKVRDIKTLTNGPGRWTRAFGIDKKFLGRSLHSGDFFVSRNLSKTFKVGRAKRIGIDYATDSRDLKLRFYIKGNPFVSRVT